MTRNSRQEERNVVDIFVQRCYKYYTTLKQTQRHTGPRGGTGRLHHRYTINKTAVAGSLDNPRFLVR